MLLVVIGSVTDLAEAMQEHGTRQAVAGLALVELLPSRAAQFGIVGIQRRDYCDKLFGVDSSRPPAAATTTTSRREAGLNALLDQRPFELRQCTEDVEQEFALRRGGVHLLGERAEGD